ncbi:MAG TPA: hypothetical protein VGC54_12135, partial [Planctomycetota bacterium]
VREPATGTVAAPAAVLGPSCWPESESVPAVEITWAGPRHLQALHELGIATATALQGEEAIRAAAVPREGGLMLARADRLLEDNTAALSELEKAIEAEGAPLMGAWMRLRRDLRKAVGDFRRRADRSQRNRGGIRGARLHALAQGLRPLGEPQEERLGLLTAAALFRLDLDALAAHLPAVGSARRGGPAVLPTAP